MNERAVRDGFRAAVVRYCNLANAAGLRTEGLTVSITVTTAEPLTVDTQKWIYDLARAHARQMLRDANEPVLSFPDTPGLPEPGFQFVFHPPALPVPRVTRRDPEAVAHPAPPGPVALLTLRYDADFVWPCRIGAAADWLAIGRWTGRPAAGSAAMQLPTYATWLPRGRLLLVRNHHGRFAFGRSAHHPQYEIRVDGVPLPAGGSVVAHVEGSIEYARDRSSTRLTYRVDWEGRHGR